LRKPQRLRGSFETRLLDNRRKRRE